MSNSERSGFISTCPQCGRQFDGEQSLFRCPDDQALLLAPTHDPLLNTILVGKYEIKQVLGLGGWSTVYRAIQRPIGRVVAVKVLQQRLTFDSDKVLRFQREAEAASKLVHPGIVTIFDYGVLPEGNPYIVMEYVDGATLELLIEKQGAMPVADAVAILTQVCDALQAAHDKDIVHRDVKPSNIAVVQSGDKQQIKILDFGLAKQVFGKDAAANLTQSGETVGTPSYMSPEQCTADELDFRSDMYSLGCVAYELFTGKVPLEGENMFQLMQKHVGEMPPGFQKTNQNVNVHPLLESAVFKALAKNPGERFRDLNDFKAALIAGAQAQQNQTASGFAAALAKFIPLHRLPLQRYGRSKRATMILVGFTAVVAVAGMALHISIINRQPTKKDADADAQVLQAAETNWQKLFHEGDGALQSDQVRASIASFEQALAQAEVFGKADDRRLKTMSRLQSAYAGAGLHGKQDAIGRELQQIEDHFSKRYLGTSDENIERISYLDGLAKGKSQDKKTLVELARVNNNQAQLLVAAGKYETAQKFLEQALVAEKKLGAPSIEQVKTLHDLASVQAHAKDFSQAQRNYQASLEMGNDIGAGPVLIASSYRGLGDVFRMQGNIDEAQRNLLMALKLLREKDPTSAEYAATINDLGLVSLEDGDFDQAEKYLRKALSLQIALFGQNDTSVGKIYANFGVASIYQKRFDDAKRYLTDALQIFDQAYGPQSVDSGLCAFNLGQAHYMTSNYALAEPLFKRTVKSCKNVPSGKKQAISALEHLEAIYEKQGRDTDAKAVQSELVELTPQ
jgi:tetratricopeptide (TPR) repeat protein